MRDFRSLFDQCYRGASGLEWPLELPRMSHGLCPSATAPGNAIKACSSGDASRQAMRLFNHASTSNNSHATRLGLSCTRLGCQSLRGARCAGGCDATDRLRLLFRHKLLVESSDRKSQRHNPQLIFPPPPLTTITTGLGAVRPITGNPQPDASPQTKRPGKSLTCRAFVV